MERNYKVYKHTSPSNKVYIGITKLEPDKRFNNGNGYYKNSHFTNAIKKYGWDNFKHEILFNNLTEEEAKLMEQFYIALYDSTNREKGYNKTLGGESSNGLKHTEETKKKMSEAKKGKYEGKNNPNYGKHLSEDTRKKISEAHKGKYGGENNPMYGLSGENHPAYGYKHTEETKIKLSKSHQGENNPMYGKKGKDNPRAKSVICITTYRIFLTTKEASEYYDIKNKSNISACCKGKHETCGKLPDGTKLVWKYLVWKHNKTYRVIKNQEVA